MRLSRSEVSLGIVCPMANEIDTAEVFVHDVLSYCTGFRSVTLFTVLDRVSKDGTLDRLMALAETNPSIQVVWAPENRSVVDAYMRGYKEALYASCDWILEIDAGYSHQPSDIPKFLEKMDEGYDCVFGSRFCRTGKISDSSPVRYLISLGGGKLANLLLGTSLSDMTSGFEMFTKESLRYAIDQGIRSKAHFFQTEIKFHCRRFKVTEVPIHYRSASPSVKPWVVMDAFKNLFRLVGTRITQRVQQTQRLLARS